MNDYTIDEYINIEKNLQKNAICSILQNIKYNNNKEKLLKWFSAYKDEFIKIIKNNEDFGYNSYYTDQLAGQILRNDWLDLPIIDDSEKEIHREILFFGFNLARNDNLSYQILKNKLFLQKYCSHFYLLPPNEFNYLLNALLKKEMYIDKKDLYSEEWLSCFSKMIIKVSKEEVDEFVKNGYDLALYFEMYDILKKNNYLQEKTINDLFESVFPFFENFKTASISENSLIKLLDTRIINLWFRENPEKAVAIIYGNKFSEYHYKIRTEFYKGYIENGFLDMKIARKIRSESSGEACEKSVRCFLENLDKYSNAKELLMNFIDISSYRYGARVDLVRFSPDYMIPYLMGFTEPYIKQILEQRLNKITKEKAK